MPALFIMHSPKDTNSKRHSELHGGCMLLRMVVSVYFLAPLHHSIYNWYIPQCLYFTYRVLKSCRLSLAHIVSKSSVWKTSNNIWTSSAKSWGNARPQFKAGIFPQRKINQCFELLDPVNRFHVNMEHQPTLVRIHLNSQECKLDNYKTRSSQDHLHIPLPPHLPHSGRGQKQKHWTLLFGWVTAPP